MVLPVRIELTTSPLPRECSTTELRQQARVTRGSQNSWNYAAILAIGAMPAQASGPKVRHCRGAVGVLGIWAMAATIKTGKADQRAARKVRLAAALRENLKRRKQQARRRAVEHKAPPAGVASQHAAAAAEAPDFRRNRDEE